MTVSIQKKQRMALRTTVRAINDVIIEDVEQTITAIRIIDFDTQFPQLLTLTVRLKILRTIVIIFKLLNNDNYIDVIKKLPLLHKRVNINQYQFSRLSTEKNRINSEYMKNAIIIIYKYVHCLKRLGY